MAKLSRHCRLVLILISDPLEKSLPRTGSYKFTDGEKHAIIYKNNEEKKDSYQKKFQHRLQHLETLSKKMNFRLLLCTTTDNPLDILR
jgi:hypothetical protein